MLDIANFVYRNFPEATQYGTPPEDYRVNCPFCAKGGEGDDTKKHLYIGIEKSMVHCFRCGYASNWINFVKDILGCSYMQAVSELYHQPDMVDFNRVIKGKKSEPEIMPCILPEDFVPLSSTNRKQFRQQKDYLLGRGFGSAYWRDYNLGVAASQPCRVIIPIEADYWQARAIFNWVVPKYINPVSPSSVAIFNSQALTVFPEIIVCEGAFSAMAAGRNAIGLVGKQAPAEKMARLVNSLPQSFILAIEPGAFDTMKILADELLAHGKSVTLWKYDQGDPNEPGAAFQEIPYDFRTKVSMMLGV